MHLNYRLACEDVEQAFEQLSEPAKAEKCPGIRLIRELMDINRDESGTSVLMCKTLVEAS